MELANTVVDTTCSVYEYHSVPGKRPWALKHNSQFWSARALTWDQNSIRLYRSCYRGPLKCGTSVLTREWVPARDTMVHVAMYTGGPVFIPVLMNVPPFEEWAKNLNFVHQTIIGASLSEPHINGNELRE